MFITHCKKINFYEQLHFKLQEQKNNQAFIQQKIYLIPGPKEEIRLQIENLKEEMRSKELLLEENLNQKEHENSQLNDQTNIQLIRSRLQPSGFGYEKLKSQIEKFEEELKCPRKRNSVKNIKPGRSIAETYKTFYAIFKASRIWCTVRY